MTSPDEQQLLELIESADHEASLRLKMLHEQNPALAARIEAMQRDRAALRSLPVIDPPLDFLAELEPQIARPMLMDEMPAAVTLQPGEARRAAHRRRLRAQLTHAAIAAGVMLVLFAGLWWGIAASGLFDRAEIAVANVDHETDLRAARPNEADQVGGALNGPAPAVADDQQRVGELHHRPPTAAAIAELVQQRVTDAETSTTTDTAHPAQPTFVVAEFALVLGQRRVDEVRRALTTSIDPIADHSAVVKNLTVVELRQIEAAWLARRAGSGQPTEPLRAGADGSQQSGVSMMPGHVSQIIDPRALRESAQQLIDAGLVAGTAELMPGYDTQIGLSGSGVEYSIVAPAQQLGAVLERLTASGTAEQALVMRAGEGDIRLNVFNWAAQLPNVRQSHDELLRNNPDALIVLPVILTDAP